MHKGSELTFFQRKYMNNKHMKNMKRSSTLLSIREM